MTRNAKPGLPRAVDGAMGAPQRFWGGSVRHTRKKVQIALYLAVFVTLDRERYGYPYSCTVFLAARKSKHSARGARAGFRKFHNFSPCIARAARARGFDSLPPSRTLLAVFSQIKQKYQKWIIHRKLTDSTSVISTRPKIQYMHESLTSYHSNHGACVPRWEILKFSTYSTY